MGSLSRTIVRAMDRATHPRPSARVRARAQWREELERQQKANPGDRAVLEAAEPLEKPKPPMVIEAESKVRQTSRIRTFLAALFGRRGQR